jgi:glycosyltransferase involved in cell wall biosynthesis
VGRRIRVLHILWSGRIGGTEEYIFNLVKRFSPEKYEIVLCLLKEKGALFDEISKFGKFRVDFIGIRSGYDILGAIKFGVYLLINRFDLIHSHMRNMLSTLILFLFCPNTPKVITHHVGPIDERLFKKNRVFYCLYGKGFDRTLAISNAVKETLIRDLHCPHPEKIVVVYNGIDTRRLVPEIEPAEDLKIMNVSKVIGFVGRMEYFKRPDLFVRTAFEIIKRHRGYHFLMVGDGTELNKCKEMVMTNGFEKYFTFTGYRRDIPQILRAMDALLFTSRGEGFGIALVEAMAMGVLVFAVNDGAVPEIIRDRGNGVLLNTIDPQVIAKEIVEILNDNQLANKIKSNAANDAKERFSIDVSAGKTEEIYGELLRTHHNG